MGSVDMPGVIGRVGTMLAQHGVNIAGWYTGRAEPGGNTLTVLTLDEELPEPAYRALEQFDFIRHARRVWIG
jgi:D-3-phosphoglycerate dehydrogenase